MNSSATKTSSSSPLPPPPPTLSEHISASSPGAVEVPGCKVTIVGQRSDDRDPETMLLMLHGVHGSIADFKRLVPAIRKRTEDERVGSSIFIVQTTCNQCKSVQLLFSKTKEGIVRCAERVADVVERVLRTHPQARNLKRMILLGHSFGGIYGRYAAKLLVDKKILPRLEPLHYISVASPHLGVRRRSGAFFSAYRALAPVLAGQCGRELLLEDDTSVMCKLADGPFLAALAMFKRRTCYGNVFHDINVPLCTATMRPRNPYRVTATTDRRSGIVGTSFVSSASDDDARLLSKGQIAFAKDTHGAAIRKMRSDLLKLGWERVDCSLWGRLGLSHVQIIGQQAGGECVQRHIADLVVRAAVAASSKAGA